MRSKNRTLTVLAGIFNFLAAGILVGAGLASAGVLARMVWWAVGGGWDLAGWVFGKI